MSRPTRTIAHRIASRDLQRMAAAMGSVDRLGMVAGRSRPAGGIAAVVASHRPRALTLRLKVFAPH